ncbi:MAG: class I SAM-dependent methyltransferase [Lysobacterales bacterium]
MNVGSNSFPDHFSPLAAQYAAWRPNYPPELFEAIAARLPPAPIRVWEAGCGSGQATLDLAARSDHMFATDPSRAQIEAHPAWPRSNEYGRVVLAVEPAEACSLPDSSVELIAVAQALHWFQRRAFFAECARVMAPGGVLACWCYQDFVAPPGLEYVVAEFRASIDAHWPAERADVDNGYSGYEWPFAALPECDLEMTADWTLPHLLGYLSSLSATARTIRDGGADPVALHRSALTAAWGDASDASDVRRVVWPVRLILRKAA